MRRPNEVTHRHPLNLRATILMTLFACASPVRAQSTLHVDDDAQGRNGQSWNTAFKFLQDALDAAANSGGVVTEIRVAQGTYKPDQNQANPNGTGERVLSFRLLDDVRILGGYAGINTPDPNARNIVTYATILSGDIGIAGDNSDNSFHVVDGTSTTASAILGSMPFLVEIANGSMSSRHLFEAALQVRLQRSAQADQLLAAAHFA